MQVETATLKAMADMVGVMSDKVTVAPTDEYWEVCAIDPAHVGMIRFRLNASAFEGYAPGTGFSVDITKLAAILKDMGEGTDIEITDTGRVVLKSGTTTRRFTQLASVEGTPTFPADRLTLESFVIFDPSEIKPRIASLCAIDQKVTLALSETGFSVMAANDEEDMTVEIGPDKCKTLSGDAKASYPSDYIQRIFKTVPKDAAMQISFDGDMPVLIKFTTDDISAEFMVAPRIEEE